MKYNRGFSGVLLGLGVALTGAAGPLLPPVQVGNLLEMTNANVRLEYDLSTGRANFYWQNSLKISGFYAGVGLDTYITDNLYASHTWTVTNNEVDITSTGNGLPTMKQVFILDQDNSFLARVDVIGSGLQSRWMGPVVMDIAGGVDIGSYGDVRALTVPFDNDSFTFSYDAMPINNTAMSYEVSAFYDNTSRNGLVVGSVTHDTWKTGVYFQGASNKLNVLNVFGGETSSDTRDVLPHGLVTGNTISSPTVFVGFGMDWRMVMEAYADANAAMAPKLPWSAGVPFGWNSWYAYTTSVNYSNVTAVSDFIKNNLQTNNFDNNGVVYINLDSFWSNLSDAQLQQFANHCHTNGQKAGIYWTPFVYWGTAAQGSNTLMTGSTNYTWSDAYLRSPDGSVLTNDGGIAIDPTHPGFKQLAGYYMNYFTTKGFDYLKLDFLTHGALEGVHYDTNVTTGIQAYNQGMQYLTQQNNGRMFLNESIAPIFPYQYAHSRRIYCDASTSITDTANTMQAVSYGWWINGRLYQYNDPDMMKFAGGTANENQSRLINCAIAGTVFLNSDDLASTAGQNLAQTCLTNEAMDEVARAGISFLPVEGNTGTNATDTFVRQDGSTWYVAVFNYATNAVNKSLNLARLGISATYTAVDLWSGTSTTVSGTTWNISLGARQAKLFRLGSGATSAAGPASQTAWAGASVTLCTVASGTPPFTYSWSRNGTVLGGQNANSVTINPVNTNNAGVYQVIVTGANGSVTNSALLTLLNPTSFSAQLIDGGLVLSWPMAYTGWRLQTQTCDPGTALGTNWSDVAGSDGTNAWTIPLDLTAPGAFFRLIHE
jgi:alpha-galactosidase